MAAKWTARVAIVVAAGLGAGCAGGAKHGPRAKAVSATDPIPGGVVDGELALSVGNPVRAIRILKSVAPEDDDYAYAQQLLADARSDADAIVQTLLSDIEGAIARRRFTAAEARCNYLLEQFPLEDAVKEQIDARLQEVAAGRAAIGKELAHTEEQARDLMLTNDLTGAVKLLKAARVAAWDADPELALDWERMIAAADAHLQLAGDGSGGDDDGMGRRRNGRRRRGNGGSGGRAAAADSSSPAAPDWEAEKRDQEISGLLNEAKVAAKRNSYFAAIKTYELVLEKMPANAEATAALERLVSQREQLIREYLAKADQYFLAQDLESAAPYYEKVLVLRPGHKRATDRLRAYENLEKIRNRKKKR